jgi:pimeloyl-ACP methyl ester carboxylesterase
MSSQLQTKYYQWNQYKCAYTVYNEQSNSDFALVLIHPIGVGLSGNFWERFLAAQHQYEQQLTIYNPDLLGCGKSDLPRVAYEPKDWAKQLNYFLQNIVKKPVILVVQGASFPIAIYLSAGDLKLDLVKGLVLSGPPAWNIMTKGGNLKISEIIWNLCFDSLIGSLFYQYARRRQFIKSFSIKELFAKAEDVDDNWLDMLEKAAVNPQNRYAVFSFLAGFWRKDYSKLLKQIEQPVLMLLGAKASSVSKDGFQESLEQRMELYQQNIPNLVAHKISGRNVIPYESTAEFVKEVNDFCSRFAELNKKPS